MFNKYYGLPGLIQKEICNRQLQSSRQALQGRDGWRITAALNLADLQHLPEEQAKQLIKEACSYADLKLAEIESRSRFRKKIQGPS